MPAFETAVAAAAVGGRTVTVGLAAAGQNARLSPLTLVAEARTVVGSYLGSSVPTRDVPMYVQWWRNRRLPVEKPTSDEIALDHINEAMDTLDDGQAVRQVIRF